MALDLRVDRVSEPPPPVDYRWDPETDILSVSMLGASGGESGMSVGLEGRDGAWLILDLQGRRLTGLEVAVWPVLRTRSRLSPPEPVVDGRVWLVGDPAAPEEITSAVEVRLAAESDRTEEVIYFRVGTAGPARTVRVGRGLLVDLDRRQRLAGLWLLNVPPYPSIRRPP